MNAPVLVASDLDRTLIYSRRSAEVPSRRPPRLVCVEHYQDAEQSFVTADALACLRQLATRTVFVPTTTRTRSQAARVAFPGVATPRYQIAANGGLLLVDGRVDEAWAEQVRRRLLDGAAPITEVWAHVGALRSQSWLLRAHQADGYFCYAIIDRPALAADQLADLTAWSEDRGWQTSVQGRKLYLVPASLNKGAAVAEVARRVAARQILAAGDSLLDRSLLEVADAAIRPGHGELADQGWSAPNLVALNSVGVMAGEQIVRWFLARSAGSGQAEEPGSVPGTDEDGRAERVRSVLGFRAPI